MNGYQLTPQLRPGERRVGVLGLGVIGAAIAKALAGLGFHVRGFSRRPKSLAGIECFSEVQLAEFLASSDILINVLPSTPATRGLLNAANLNQLPQGAALINIGRGDSVNETDLLAALDDGQLSYAALDVFSTEPLPANHLFWRHPKITLTPHIASLTNPITAAGFIVEQIREFEATGKVAAVDPKQAY